MDGATGAPLPLSVIVPAHRCAPTLRLALEALAASDLPRDSWELIVVDDASGDSDPTADVAAAYADRVIRLTGRPHGPAFARNRGAEVARGALLAFVDADVVVHADALRRMVELLAATPDAGALFGAYDDRPAAPGIVSRYRNLMHHYVHTEHAGDAETFWAGCGAVRRTVFEQVGGYDEVRYPRPQIEDIELGHRIRDLGQRILLRPEIQGTHLKRWTLRSMVVADVRDRGVPWVELLLEEGSGARASTLNVGGREKLYTALVGLAGASALAGLATRDGRWLLAAGGSVLVVLAGNQALLRWFWREHGVRMALAAAPLRLLHYGLSGVAVAWGGARHLRRRSSMRSPRVRPRAIALPHDSPQVG